MSGSSSPNGTSAGACARCVGVATTAGVRVLSVGQATGRGEPPLLPDSVETAASAALELVREVLLLRVGVPSRISLNDTSSDMPAEAKRSVVRAGDVAPELLGLGGHISGRFGWPCNASDRGTQTNNGIVNWPLARFVSLSPSLSAFFSCRNASSLSLY